MAADVGEAPADSLGSATLGALDEGEVLPPAGVQAASAASGEQSNGKGAGRGQGEGRRIRAGAPYAAWAPESFPAPH